MLKVVEGFEAALNCNAYVMGLQSSNNFLGLSCKEPYNMGKTEIKV